MEEQFLTKADVVTTGTYELWNMHRVQRPDAEFIQCGVDFELFNRPAGPMPEDLAGLPQPMIGYWGSISDRLDFRLLEKLARQLPQASLVLIGPVRTSLLLPQAPNIYYLGLKPTRNSHDTRNISRWALFHFSSMRRLRNSIP